MRRHRLQAPSWIGNTVLIGSAIILIATVGVFVSYQADKGLPFVPYYQVYFDVPDAAEMVPGSEVRIGGTRVGQVVKIKAIPGRHGQPAYARLEGHLTRLNRLPVDSVVAVRPRSILGAKYLDLQIGRARRTILSGGTLPLRQSRQVVELSDAFNLFDAETTRGLRATISGLGDSVAGRGQAINDAIGAARALMGPLQRVTRNLVAPSTDLAGFIRGAAGTMRALAPVSSQLGSLVDEAATTLQALDTARTALGQALEELPPTEATGTVVLRRVTPVLRDTAGLLRDIRPGTALLPAASARLDSAVRAGTPVLRRGPQLVRPLTDALSALDRLARDPVTTPTLRSLLAAVRQLAPVAATLLPAQVQCNLLGVSLRNLVSVGSRGDANGAWLPLTFLADPSKSTQTDRPAADLHANPYPTEDWSECEAGNEPYSGGQLIGPAPGRQPNRTEETSPPPGVQDLARRAGLLTPTPGSSAP